MALPRKLASQIYEIKAHTGKVTSLDLGETGRVLVTGGSDRNVNLWAIGEEKCFMSLPGHNGTVDCVRFAYNDDFVYSADDIGIIRRWDLNAQSICSTLNGHMKSVKTLDFNPSGEYVVSGSNDTTVRLWDVRNQNRCIKTYRGHIANVNSVKFSPDGLWIASAGTEGSVIIWDIRKSKQIAQLTERGASPITCIQYHPNEFLLAAGRNDGSVYIYDLETNQLISKTENSKSYGGQTVKCITFSENGECLFVGTAEGISVIGWEPNREFDKIESSWNFLGDIKIVNNKLICGSFEREKVTVHALSIDRVFPFYEPSNNQHLSSSLTSSSSVAAAPGASASTSETTTNNITEYSPFGHNQSTRKSFSRGNHKLRISIGPSASLSATTNHSRPTKVSEEEYEETATSPSLDGGGNSSPNLSIELVDIEEPNTQQNSSTFETFINAKKQNSPYNFPSISSTASSRSSGMDDRVNNGIGTGGGSTSGISLNSLKMPGESERDFEKVIDSYDSDLGYNLNDLDKTQYIPNYEEPNEDNFTITTPQMPIYDPRYDSYNNGNSIQQQHNSLNLHQHNYQNSRYLPTTASTTAISTSNTTNNKPTIAAKPKVPFISATSSTTIIQSSSRKNNHTGGNIPIKISGVPSNTTERAYQRKLSGMKSVSTMELHKMDENMSSNLVGKKSTIPSRFKREITTTHHQHHQLHQQSQYNHQNHHHQHQQQINKENNTKNNRNIQVQIITKVPPPRSKTSFDLRGPPQFPTNNSNNLHSINNSLITPTPAPRLTSYTTDDANEIHTLTSYHKQIYSELSNRYATLQLIRNSTRAQDVVGALKQAIKISGRTVFVDLLGAILEKTSTWNLDMCLLLLPEIYALLQSQHKFHHTRACDTLRVILKNFLPIIQDNIDPWSAANSLGVDITRDERQRKCCECQQWLLRIRSLPSDTHIGSALAQLQNMITF